MINVNIDYKSSNLNSDQDKAKDHRLQSSSAKRKNTSSLICKAKKFVGSLF
jgi:hypothetical protein